MEVRIYECEPETRYCLGENGWEDRHLARQRVECNWSGSTRAVWMAPGPVVFKKPLAVALRPFADRPYQTLDDLVVDLRRGNYLITDFRMVAGTVGSVKHALSLLDDHILEGHRGELILVRRLTAALHDSIWMVEDDVVKDLIRFKLVTAGCHTYPIVYRCGPHTLLTLSKREARHLHNCEDLRERLRIYRATGQMPSAAAPSTAGQSARLRTLKTRKAKVAVPNPVAHDHAGNPITEQDIARESIRVPPRGMPGSLIPEVGEDCPDDEFERLMLIEQIRFRRRSEARAGSE